MEPENVEVLEMAGAVFLETGDIDKAKAVSFKLDMFIILMHRLCLFSCYSACFLSVSI